MIIYKYLEPDAAIKTIKNGSVLLRLPEEFNDPFDCLFYVSKNEIKRAFKLFVNYYCFKTLYSEIVVKKKKPVRFKCNANILVANIKSLVPRINETSRYTYQLDISTYYRLFKTLSKTDDKEMRKEFESTFKKVMKEIRQLPLISCFSMCSNSILMWSHYAKNHTGACIEYEIEDANFKTIKYLKKMKSFKLTKILEYVFGSEFSGKKIDYENKTFHFLIEPILAKAFVWKYEKEIRCIFSNKNRDERIYTDNEGKTLLKMPKIKKIIIGCNAKKEFVDKIKEMLDIAPIFKMKIIEGQYKIVEDPFNEKI